METVDVAPLDPERFREVLDDDGYRGLQELVGRARRLFEGRRLWNVNSTARGGGVAEMLASLLAYTKGAGVDSRWLVIPGQPEFFRVTKRLHNLLHGAAGDGGPLGDRERETYERGLAAPAAELRGLVKPRDVVIVHDPQTAGLIEPLREAGAHVVWRLHIGADDPNDHVRRAQAFLRPYVAPADAWVFTRPAFTWDGLDPACTYVIPPSIDVFSAKNQDLEDEQVASILAAADIVADPAPGAPEYLREDGSTGVVGRRAEVLETTRLTLDRPLVVQVSRWDALKDHVGVVRAFAEHVAPHVDADLVVAGPAADAVADDPEGAEELERVKAAWQALPSPARDHVHVAQLPMDDREENAAIVNALQRHARVVVQKSLAEGFGLTVSEGMWKSRPVVAAAVGGIQEQVVPGETGWLVDPRDLEAFGARVRDLLADPVAADRMGAAGRRRVREHFTGVRHLGQWVDLVEELSPRR